MNKYTCIVVDDEVLARELLAAHIAKIPYLKLLASCANATDAASMIEKNQPDILFLDIHLPDHTGIEFLKLLQKRPATIITTAYSEHSLEGYELDVLDYILKPIEFERFFKATNKAVEWIERGQPTENKLNLENTVEPADNYFFVKADYKILKVVFDDILFIEALQKYVRIHTATERIMTLMSMRQLEENLPKGKFLRIHRSYIINLDKINSIEGNTVHIGKHQIAISRGQKDEFVEWIKKKGLSL